MGLLLELADRGSLRALLSDNDASLSLSKAAKLAIARDVAAHVGIPLREVATKVPTHAHARTHARTHRRRGLG